VLFDTIGTELMAIDNSALRILLMQQIVYLNIFMSIVHTSVASFFSLPIGFLSGSSPSLNIGKQRFISFLSMQENGIGVVSDLVREDIEKFDVS
jgi:hypothetical protein